MTVPNPNPTQNIPDLLLEAVDNSGTGLLADIDFIQRLRSQGGVGPTGPCNPATDVEVAVRYSAAYFFYRD